MIPPRDKGLRVIAITDHNAYVNVQYAIDHAQNNHAGQVLVLAGVEVTTAHGHLLVYFAPERVADLAKFLAKLDLIGDMGADNTRTAKSMADTIAEAEKLGGLCIAAHIDRPKTGFEVFASGFQNWKRDIIHVLACTAWSAIRWTRSHGTPSTTRPGPLALSAEIFSRPASKLDISRRDFI